MSASYTAPEGAPTAAVEQEQLAIAMPLDRASAAASALAASTSRMASIFASLGAATSASQYLNIASSSGLQQAVDQMNQDFINVGNALPGS